MSAFVDATVIWSCVTAGFIAGWIGCSVFAAGNREGRRR